jgi:hypothetical protein
MFNLSRLQVQLILSDFFTDPAGLLTFESQPYQIKHLQNADLQIRTVF